MQKKLYGARGIYIPAGTSPNVHIASLTAYGVIVNWTGAAAWIAQHFYEYYKFTKDEEMLNEKIIPFLKEVALFYEDFLVEKDGVYISYPSVSPENTPANFINNNNCKDGFDLMAHQMPVVKNATMDFALIKEVITNLIECSVDIEKYSKMLSKIPNYKVNDDGAICEWIDEDLKDNYRHRHIPHLYPVFPGKENVGRNLKKAFKKALDLREMGGQTGWSLCHSSCVYSRLQEPQQAYKCLEILLKSCVMDNFFTNHNDYRQMGQTVDMWDWAPQQLDANLGFVQAIHEMLIYFDNDSIKILPSCPFDFGNVSNINTPFGEISFRWNKDDVKIEINSTVNRKVKIIILDKSSDYLLKKGEKTCITKME